MGDGSGLVDWLVESICNTSFCLWAYFNCKTTICIKLLLPLLQWCEWIRRRQKEDGQNQSRCRRGNFTGVSSHSLVRAKFYNDILYPTVETNQLSVFILHYIEYDHRAVILQLHTFRTNHFRFLLPRASFESLCPVGLHVRDYSRNVRPGRLARAWLLWAEKLPRFSPKRLKMVQNS